MQEPGAPLEQANVNPVVQAGMDPILRFEAASVALDRALQVIFVLREVPPQHLKSVAVDSTAKLGKQKNAARVARADTVASLLPTRIARALDLVLLASTVLSGPKLHSSALPVPTA